MAFYFVAREPQYTRKYGRQSVTYAAAGFLLRDQVIAGAGTGDLSTQGAKNETIKTSTKQEADA